MRSGAPIDCGHTWTTTTRTGIPDDHRCGRAMRHDGDHMCLSQSSSCRATKPRKGAVYTSPHTAPTLPLAGLSNRPCLLYSRHNADGHWVDELRGIRFFEELRNMWIDMAKIDGGHAAVEIGQSVKIPPCRDSILFITMPNTPTDDGIRFFVEYTERAAMVADVVADVFDLAHRTEAQEVAALARNTRESEEYWARPDVLERFFQILQTAAVITTSWEHLAEPLTEFTGRPTIYLPDWHEEDGGAAFQDALIDSVFPAVRAAPRP